MRLDEFERHETVKLRKFMENVELMVAGKSACEGVAGTVVSEFLPLLRNKMKSEKTELTETQI